MLIPNEQDQLENSVVLTTYRYGSPPVEICLPGDATGKDAAILISKILGIVTGVWSGLKLVTNSGECIPLESSISPWNGQSVRLGITHSSVLTRR